MKITCPFCEGEYTPQGIKTHQKHCKKAQTLKSSSPSQTEGTQLDPREGTENTKQKVQEVNLMSEFEANKTKIEPVKKEEKETENNYKCGSCNEEFYMKRRPSRCPYCGCGFNGT